jgi:hypothetical protein
VDERVNDLDLFTSSRNKKNTNLDLAIDFELPTDFKQRLGHGCKVTF